MPIRLYDTMTRAKVELRPADPKRVTMYVCGPTVYGRAHIGNARPAVVFDVLARLLRHEYGADHVVYARNITDIDDKIIAAAAASGETTNEIAGRFERHYLDDMRSLGVALPDRQPHATAYIPDMVAMIGDLIAKGAAYHVAGHEVLFDVSAARYPILSRQSLDQMQVGSRAERLPYKRNEFDFVLWKPSTPDQPGWDSPWGRGRPGWHIECSTMIAAELGTTIDIHGGGLDLIFPHHENELAQSACAHDGAPLANIWMHNGFLNMGADKMSKSVGNVATVEELLAAGWHPEVLRLALLSGHYRQPLAWTEELLIQSKAIFEKFCESAFALESFEETPVVDSEIDGEFVRRLSDDLNTHNAVQRLHEISSEIAEAAARMSVASVTGNIEDEERANQTSIWLVRKLRASGRLLGMNFDPSNIEAVRTLLTEVEHLKIEDAITARTAARARRDFAESDRIRDDLAAQGIVLEDGPAGTTWRRA